MIIFHFFLILHFPNRLISSLFLKTLGDLPRGVRDLSLVFFVPDLRRIT